jgi:uncharacterized protein (DUF1330 family)
MKSMIAALLLLAAPAAACEGPPVIMVVSGPTHDAPRMRAYGEAIAKSGLYQKLGGYYLNVPRPIATFEGETGSNHTLLMVRFPCLANAKAFWHSRDYQERIKPMRLNPSAGDYSVTVYPEAPLRADLTGKVTPPLYLQRFDAGGIEQVAPRDTKQISVTPK